MQKQKKIAVIIPVHNEAESIGRVIEALPDFVDEIIVVNDGSTDQTADVLRRYSCTVVTHDKCLGLGSAFRSGIQTALQTGCDLAVTVDGDNQFDVSFIAQLIAPIIEGKADVVLGSRFYQGTFPRGIPPAKLWGNRLVSFIVSRIAQHRFWDVSCGFRAYTREALLRLNIFGRFTYTHESILALVFQGMRFTEMPVTAAPSRERGVSKISGNLVMYGLHTLKIILQTCRDFVPLKFFHRIGMIFLVPSIVTGLFVLGHFFIWGAVTPYKIVGIFSMVCFFVYLACLMTGFLMEGVARIRYNQEELIFLIKARGFPDKKEKSVL